MPQAIENPYTLPPINTHKPSDPTSNCLKAPFWHQKVRSKPFFVHIFDNITHKNNNLTGSDPAIPAIPAILLNCLWQQKGLFKYNV